MDNYTDYEDDPFSDSENNTCSETILMMGFLHLSLLPSLFITVLLSILEKRSRRCRCDEQCPKCAGCCGVLMPLDAAGPYSNRWSLAFAFGVTADKVMFLFDKDYIPDEIPKWVHVFWILLIALEVGFSSYPFFVCLSTKYEITGAILGFLYTVAWTMVIIVDIIECPEGGMILGEFNNIIMRWPSLLFQSFLLGRFLFIFMNALRKRYRQKTLKEDTTFQDNHQVQYVQQLLRKPPLEQPQKSWIQRKLYQWDPNFKFPTRIISTVVLIVVCLYMFIITGFLLIKLNLLPLLKLGVTNLNELLSSDEETKPWVYTLNEFVAVAEGVWIVTTIISAATCTGYIFNILACYRKQIKLLRAGRRYLVLAENMTLSSSQSVVSLSKFISCQVAFILWGYFIMHLLQFAFGMALMYILILPMKHGQWKQLLDKWGTLILTFVIVFAFKKMQVIVASRFFLQPKISPNDRQKPLALDNRRAFINFSFFLFFHSVVVGLMSCLMRLFRSIILGAWLVGRIDRPVMPRGYEQCDSGFSVWIGMLFLDHYHTNPILVCFCQILCASLKEKDSDTTTCITLSEPMETVPKVLRKAKTRWLVLYTLLNNPSIQKSRKIRPWFNSVAQMNNYST